MILAKPSFSWIEINGISLLPVLLEVMLKFLSNVAYDLLYKVVAKKTPEPMKRYIHQKWSLCTRGIAAT